MTRVLVLPLLVGAVLVGCQDECDPNTDLPSCEGNTLVSCPLPGPDQIVPIRISRTDCARRFCVTKGSLGLCALEPEPSALCADAGESVCESDTSRVRCAAGFVTSRDECLDCFVPDGGSGNFVTCEGGPSSRCASDSDCVPSLRCSTNGFCFAPAEG